MRRYFRIKIRHQSKKLGSLNLGKSHFLVDFFGAALAAGLAAVFAPDLVAAFGAGFFVSTFFAAALEGFGSSFFAGFAATALSVVLVAGLDALFTAVSGFLDSFVFGSEVSALLAVFGAAGAGLEPVSMVWTVL